VNVVTVGSLAHGEGIGPEFGEDVHVQPITRALSLPRLPGMVQGSAAD
jgi:hypothetical protein